MRFIDLVDVEQRAKLAEKVHNPPLGVNVINFELNGFNAFMESLRHQEDIINALIEVFKFI